MSRSVLDTRRRNDTYMKSPKKLVLSGASESFSWREDNREHMAEGEVLRRTKSGSNDDEDVFSMVTGGHLLGASCHPSGE